MGDYQARFCERFRGETPLYLLDHFVDRIRSSLSVTGQIEVRK